MTDQDITFPKRRELGEIINDSFHFFRQERNILTKLLLTYILPFAVLFAFVQIYVQMNIFSNVDLTNPEDVMSKMGPIYKHLLLTMLFSIFVQSLLAGTLYSFIEVYVKKGRDNFHQEEITSLLFANSLKALGANLIFFIMVLSGVMLCILPGFFFANTFSPVVMILVFEKKGLGNALSRSWQLVNQQWWNTLMVNIVGLLTVGAASFLLSFPMILAGAGNAFLNMSEGVNYPDWYWILMGVSTVVTTLLYVIPYTFLAFQYFNLLKISSREGDAPGNLSIQ